MAFSHVESQQQCLVLNFKEHFESSTQKQMTFYVKCIICLHAYVRAAGTGNQDRDHRKAGKGN